MFVMSHDPSGPLKGVSVLYMARSHLMCEFSRVRVSVCVCVSLRGKKTAAKNVSAPVEKRQTINTTMDQDMISYTAGTLSGSPGEDQGVAALLVALGWITIGVLSPGPVEDNEWQ